MEKENSLQLTNNDSIEAVIRSVALLWAESTTDMTLTRREDLIHDKAQAINSFFTLCRKRPAEVDSADVKEWQGKLEDQGLKPSTIYTRTCFLSSFYRWAITNSPLDEQPIINPVALARPKKPKPYRTERTKSLLDDELRVLITFVREKATEPTNIVAKRDYALLQWYVKTGRRRNEVIALRGSDVQLRIVTKDGVREEFLIVRYRIKGGRFLMCELRDPVVRTALFDYLTVGNRREVLQSERPLWTRHDRAGRPGAPLTSHAFVKNLKRYAKEAGLDHIHNHMTRHTFARIVNEETGSLLETQEALDHEDQATTRIYLESIAIKRDKYSERISRRVDE
jgi:site-specific recombinase XerD